MHSVRVFLTAHGAASFATGIHQVLLAWLSIQLLHLTSVEIGWVQCAALLPTIGWMLVAGVWADRTRPILLMVLAQILMVLSFIGLALLVYKNSLNFSYLLVYAVLVGTANAFVQPVREKIVGELSDHSLQIKISRASLVQFSLQSLGIVLASSSEYVGLLAIIGAQIIATLISAALLYRLSLQKLSVAAEPPGRELSSNLERGFRTELKQGIAFVLKDKPMGHLLALIAFNGFVHMGVFLVAVPIIARDVYHLNALQYGMLQFSFVAGMLLAYLLLLNKPKQHFPGQGALFSLLYSAIVGFALARTPTLTGLYMLLVFWGWVAGHSSTHCRVVLQQLATKQPELKGRLVSIYQMTLFGMAPLGALVVGYVAEYHAVGELFQAMAIASVLLFVVFLFSRSLWQIRQE